ncbi:MAG: type II secretion system F family protein [Chloroflexota bacterium]|nr:type II secretion system F family protein [Chloroflexota bacterium]
MSTLEMETLWRLLGLCLLFALGVYLMVTSLPAFRPKPNLRERLRRMDIDERGRMESERLGNRMFDSPYLESLLRPLFEELGEGLRRLRQRIGVGEVAELERQLAVAHPGLTVGQFYGKKLLMAAIGCSPWLGNFLAIHAGPLWAWLGMGLIAFAVPDYQLRGRIERRRAEALAELEPLLDLVSIATAARLAPEEALIEVVGESDGPVARELGRAVTEMRFGVPLSEVLETMAGRNNVPELTLFVRQLRSAMELGTPLAEALAAQAEALREQRRTLLLRQGGRATIRMVVPVALFILPVFVAVLLVPAVVQVLQLGR